MDCGNVYGHHGLVNAINRANRGGGGTINLDDDCTYTVRRRSSGRTGLPPIRSAIVINGNDSEITRSRSRNTPTFRLFSVERGKLDLRRLTLSHGFAPAEREGGGAVSIDPGAALRISHSTLRDNGAAKTGGAILNVGGTARVTDSLIVRNKAHERGAGAIGSSGTTAIIDSRVSRNSASISGAATAKFSAQGGGIVNFVGATMTVVDTVVDHNRASATGKQANSQAAGLGNYGNLTVVDSSITYNTSTATGFHAQAAAGGIGNRRGSGDSVPTDGHLMVTGETTVAHNSAIVNGDSAFGAFAGGIANSFGGVAVLRGTDIFENLAAATGTNGLSVGGGVLNGDLQQTPGTHITLRDSEVTENTAAGPHPSGGGIAKISGSVLLRQTEVRANSPDQCSPPGSVPGCRR